MTEEHADETMVASMRADTERQGADDRKVTDAPHYLARVLMANGIRNMYGVVGIPVTDFARIAQGMGMRFVGMRHEEDAVNAAGADGFGCHVDGICSWIPQRSTGTAGSHGERLSGHHDRRLLNPPCGRP